MSYKIGNTTVLSGTTATNIAGIDGQSIAGFRKTYEGGPWTTVHSVNTSTTTTSSLIIPLHRSYITTEGTIFPMMRLRFNRVRMNGTASDTVAIRWITGNASSNTIRSYGYTYYMTGGYYSSTGAGNQSNSSYNHHRLTGFYGTGASNTLGYSGEFIIDFNPKYRGVGDVGIVGASVNGQNVGSFPGIVTAFGKFGGGNRSIDGAELYAMRIYPGNSSNNSFARGSQFSLSYCFDNNIEESQQSGA
jgi:hypothetical protein